MTGLNKIIEKIAQDSAAKCDGIIFNAQNEATKIKEAALELANEEKEAVIAEANKEAKVIVDTAESGSELENKKVILATKVDIINKTIEEAERKLANMPDDEYFAAVYALVKKYSQAAEGEMLLSSDDINRLPKDFESKVNEGLADGAKIAVSKTPANISQGFILVYGDIEINCTFDALIDDARDDIKDELYSIIFA